MGSTAAATAALLLALASLGGRPALSFAPPPPQPPPPPAPSAPAADSLAPPDYPDYQGTARFDEYPVVVPKRTALLLDRIVTELQRAMGEGDAAGGPRLTAVSPPDAMGLQRRGQQKGSRVYWRCYFNAVACFRRK